MAELKHWTERSTDDFLYRLGADYVRQLEGVMDGAHRRAAIANTLGVTKGRVSQVFNNPGNLTLKKMIEYARALGRKVAVVVYDDGDSVNANGPISGQIFTSCWDKAGKPTDFFSLNDSTLANYVIQIMPSNRIAANGPYFTGSYQMPDGITPTAANSPWGGANYIDMQVIRSSYGRNDTNCI